MYHLRNIDRKLPWLAVLCWAGLAFGEVLFAPATQADFGEKSPLRVDADGVVHGASQLAGCVKRVPIEPQARYRLSAEFKKAPGAPAGKVSGILGTMQYDAKGRLLKGVQNSFIAGSEAKLLGQVAAGDTVMVVEANPAWVAAVRKAPKRNYAAFLYARRDFGDMPSFSYCWIKSQTIQGKIIVLQLDRLPALNAGSLVRLHVSGWISNGVEVQATDEWQQASVEIQGVSAQAALRHWWKGATQFSLAVFGKDLLFRNLRLEKVEE